MFSKISKKKIVTSFALLAIIIIAGFAPGVLAAEDCSKYSGPAARENCEEDNRKEVASQQTEDCGKYSDNIRQAELCEQKNAQIIQARNNGDGQNTPIGDPETDLASDCNGPDIHAGNCNIIKWILNITNAMSAIVGIVIVIMIVVRGMQYMTARDNIQQVAAAKMQFLWLIIAFGVYLFSFAILQWLIPGGLI